MSTSLLLRRTPFLLAALCLALFACNEEDDDAAGGPGLPPGGTGGPPAATGQLAPPALDAETPFEVTHEGALHRLFLVRDLIPRRLTELRDFRSKDFMDAVRDAIGGEEGRADCGGSGTVSRSLETRTLRDPFSGEDDSFSGEVITFSNCVFAELREIAIETDRVFDGTMTVLSTDDRTLFIELEGPFRLDREGETLGMPYSDRRSSTMAWFEKPTGTADTVVSLVGTWESYGAESIGNVAAEAGQFDLLGFGGSGEAEALRRDVTAPGEPESGNPSARRLRMQVDRRSTDSQVEPCVAPGRFDLESVEEEITRGDGTVVARVVVDTFTGAGGVTAEVRPAIELINDNIPMDNGIQVTIGGDTRVFDRFEAGALRDAVEDTCRVEFTGFGW